METMAPARESGQAERRVNARPDALWPGQCQMIRSAQIAFDGSVVDCALLDTARGGARVHLLAPAEVPEIVIPARLFADLFPPHPARSGRDGATDQPQCGPV
jgi:hypothetical protein